MLWNGLIVLDRDLSADLTTDKIAEIRAKLLSNRRTRIKPGEDDDVRTAAIGMGDMEVRRLELVCSGH